MGAALGSARAECVGGARITPDGPPDETVRRTGAEGTTLAAQAVHSGRPAEDPARRDAGYLGSFTVRFLLGASPSGSDTRSAIRGASILGVASVAVKPVWLVFMLAACPRILGVEGFGAMQTALALASIAIAVSEFGISTHVLREVARARDRGRELFGRAAALRTALVLGAVLGAVSVGLLLGYERALLLAVVGAGIYLGAQSLSATAGSFLRAYTRPVPEALFSVADRVLVVALGGAALLAFGTAEWTLAGMAVAGALALAVQAVWVSRRVVQGQAPRERRLGRLLWVAAPLGAANALAMLYARTDQMMIEAMLGVASAGQYAQAYRLLEALSLLPALFVQGTLFSRLSRLDDEGDADGFRRLFRNGALLLTAASVTVSGALVAVAPWLVRALTGDPAFDPAADVLRVLAWTFPFTCAKDLLFVTFISRREHAAPIGIYLGAAAANALANVAVIPIYGIAGAALTTLATEAAVVVLYLVALRRR